ncbi:SDR family NAD(P)-dependent oxidoreductase [Gordonia terrae]
MNEPFSNLDLTGKAMIVTGAGGGIGRATARLLAARGASVLVTDVNQSAVSETAELISEVGGQASSLQVDVSREDDVRAMVDETVARFGRLDGAFNNAGIGPSSALHDTSAEDWHRVIDINLTGVFYCLKYEIAHMIKHGGGAIVNTSSEAGARGLPSVASYVASKHGVVGLTRAASTDYAKYGIRVNAVMPGFIVTPMTAATLNDPDFAPTVAAVTPAGTVGKSEDIAEQVAWLLSDAAAYSSGSQFFVDGGWNGS